MDRSAKQRGRVEFGGYGGAISDILLEELRGDRAHAVGGNVHNSELDREHLEEG